MLDNRNYVFDALGSVLALTDATGAVTDTYTYDEYGRLLSRTGSIESAWFAGLRHDFSLGTYEARYRDYLPNTGRFLSRDPLTRNTENPYAYAKSNAVNARDLLGLWTMTVGVTGSAGAGVGIEATPISIVVDGNGNWGIAASVGGGAFGSIAAGGGAVVAVTNYDRIEQTGGVFYELGGSGGEALVGGGGVLFADDKTTAVGGFVTVGAGGGIPVEAHYHWTNTWIKNMGNISDAPQWVQDLVQQVMQDPEVRKLFEFWCNQ